MSNANKRIAGNPSDWLMVAASMMGVVSWWLSPPHVFSHFWLWFLRIFSILVLIFATSFLFRKKDSGERGGKKTNP